MIFYFTGTGNSGYVANEIAKANDDKVISISKLVNEEKDLEFTLKEDEVIGFIFPIYAWAPPKIVSDFIRKVKFNNYKNNYIFSVATCGENIGNTMEIIKKDLNKKGMKLDSGFSLVMPNNYIILGDVDPKEEERKKLEEAKDQINKINTIIKERRKEIFELEKGFAPAILSNIINPFFNKFGMNISKFYSTDDCISCGICERVCNSNIITLIEGKPTWKGNCCQCLACINYCPKKAIQYGKSTVKKGRYVNPNFKI